MPRRMNWKRYRRDWPRWPRDTPNRKRVEEVVPKKQIPLHLLMGNIREGLDPSILASHVSELTKRGGAPQLRLFEILLKSYPKRRSEPYPDYERVRQTILHGIQELRQKSMEEFFAGLKKKMDGLALKCVSGNTKKEMQPFLDKMDEISQQEIERRFRVSRYINLCNRISKGEEIEMSKTEAGRLLEEVTMVALDIEVYGSDFYKKEVLGLPKETPNFATEYAKRIEMNHSFNGETHSLIGKLNNFKRYLQKKYGLNL